MSRACLHLRGEHICYVRQVDAILFLDVRALLWTTGKRLLAWRRYLRVRALDSNSRRSPANTEHPDGY